MKQPMTVLAFDTASEMLALAVGVVSAEGLQVLATLDEPAPRKADQVLLPRARQLLEQVGLAPAQLDAVVVGRDLLS